MKSKIILLLDAERVGESQRLLDLGHVVAGLLGDLLGGQPCAGKDKRGLDELRHDVGDVFAGVRGRARWEHEFHLAVLADLLGLLEAELVADTAESRLGTALGADALLGQLDLVLRLADGLHEAEFAATLVHGVGVAPRKLGSALAEQAVLLGSVSLVSSFFFHGITSG